MRDSLPRLFYGVGLALMAGWILVLARPIILPVMASIVVAYVVLGMVELVERIPGLRRLPAALRYGLAVAACLAGVALILWLIVTNFGQVATLMPRYQEQLLAMIQRGAIGLGIDDEPNWETLRRDVLQHINMQRVVLASAASVASIVGSFTVVLIYAGFLLAEKGAFANKIALLSDEPAKVAQIQALIRDINSRIGTYLVMKTLVNIMLGVSSYAILRGFGIEFAAFWALLIGLFNYVPYFGGIVGVALPTLLAILQFGDFWQVFVFVLAMCVPQVALGNFIEPWLMGKSLNLSPFVILVGLVSWMSMWGIAGAILSVPIMAILVIIFSEFESTRPIAVLLSKKGEIE
ncbi:AI-2E family transporter [Amaricoccus sp.]|uniref:AI-2E family transporter n=1 Tax=Amaricoccus sp. TaxID=1872485 RepID=UPI00260C5E52|nr:AI-2E family transporter [Amaricoccus sp.]HRO10570.1 AI-2E family transporter [Amaricoccus sp.]